MMKSYKITNHINSWECRVDIDEDFLIPGMELAGQPYTTGEAIKSMVDFWMGFEDRLSENEGDYTKTFLQQLGREILLIHIQDNYNLVGVTGAFDNREGWFPMDGSAGITIKYLDDFDFEHRDFEAEEVVA